MQSGDRGLIELLLIKRLCKKTDILRPCWWPQHCELNLKLRLQYSDTPVHLSVELWRVDSLTEMFL